MNLSANYNGSFWTNVFVSICIIGIVYAGLLYLGFLYQSSQYFSLSFSEMLTYKNTVQSKLVYALFTMIHAGTLLLIGYYIGAKAYRFSWLYSGIVGAIWVLVFMMVMIVFTLFTLDQYSAFRTTNQTHLQSQYEDLSLIFFNLPISFLKAAGLTSLGGASSALLRSKFKKFASY